MIHATHFVDSHYFLLRPGRGEYIINGKGYEFGYQYHNNDIVVEGDTLEIREVSKTSYIAYYKHREKDITLSVAEYNKLQAGYKEGSGYKSIEDEYASKKLAQDYIGVTRTEEVAGEPIAVNIEEAIEHPECKFIKPLYTLSADYHDGGQRFYLYEYDAFADFTEWIVPYMEAHGFVRKERYRNNDGLFYFLNRIDEYTKFGMTGCEYVITDHVFSKDGKITGTYKGVLQKRAEMTDRLKALIDDRIDSCTTQKVRVSTIEKLHKLRNDISFGMRQKPEFKRLIEIIDEIDKQKR